MHSPLMFITLIFPKKGIVDWYFNVLTALTSMVTTPKSFLLFMYACVVSFEIRFSSKRLSTGGNVAKKSTVG